MLIGSYATLTTAAAVCSNSNSNTVPNDPAACRMIINANQTMALVANNMNAASSSAIIARFDLVYDPASANAVNPWIAGVDALGSTAYSYTRPAGPLGSNGPLGAIGPISSVGALSSRFTGTQPTVPGISYSNNWCNVPANQPDTTCVYGSYGPLGESGALNPYAYYNTMYHLMQGVYWYNNFAQNLDTSGVWGILGPLGPLGPLSALGALGPLGISLQAGMTTTTNGVYMNGSTIVRKTQPVRYSHDATIYRTYDLYEMYSKSYALNMGTGCSGCEVNDTSFAVDSRFLEPPTSGGDNFLFDANYDQFLSINVVPVNLLNDYAVQLSVSTNGGVSYSPVATSNSNVYAVGGGLMDYIVTRTRAGEKYRVNVSRQVVTVPNTGYYLYVSGTGLAQTVNGVPNNNADIWSSRLQNNGTYRFNINGAHQNWVSW